MTPTERALRLSVALTEREQEMYSGLRSAVSVMRGIAKGLEDSAFLPGISAMLNDEVDRAICLLSRLESVVTEPATDPAPTTLGA